jgi:uncharacterized protein
MAGLSGRPAPLGIAAELWDILACPCPDHAPVAPDEASGQVVCTRCGTRFDVRDGVPVMLLDEATPGPGGVGVVPEG